MIEVMNVSKFYHEKAVLSGVSFKAEDGRVTGFVGPNGAGKSTLLRIVSGVTRPSGGSVRISQQEFTESQRPGSHLGIFLSAELIPENMTAWSFLAWVCDTQGMSHGKVSELLDVVNLSHAANGKVKTFSLGMRQRLGIAAAFVGDPKNLILDEPINGLDPDAIQWIRHFLRDAAARGKAVLISSHHMSELALVADDVVLLNQGTVARQGSLQDFLSASERNVYIESNDLPGIRLVLENAGLSATVHPPGVLVHDAEPDDVGRMVYRANYSLTHLSVPTRSLEETYFETIGAQQPADGGLRR